jgi:acyl-CoA synthetase (AMP-forming)/AMP-acid ligase II
MTSSFPLPAYWNVPDDEELFGSFRGIVQYEQLHQQAADLSPEPVPDSQMLTGGNTSLALVLYTSGSTGIPKGNQLASVLCKHGSVHVTTQQSLNKANTDCLLVFWQWKGIAYKASLQINKHCNWNSDNFAPFLKEPRHR